MLADSEFVNLRNRFKKDADLLMQGVSAGDSNEKSQEEKDAKPLPRINRHSVFWIVASVGLTYYFDCLRVITENGDIKSWWFNVGVILLGICLALAMFCIVYLEWFKGIQHYDHDFNIALWPVWSFLTPVLLFTQFMGVVMLISML
ncbi:unnamed protein product, partial [Coregonus sp. 'balchen']